MIHAAIAGLGRWGRSLVAASLGRPRLQIVCAVEPALDGARDFCTRHGLRLVDDLDIVLADPAIDAVLLATPHSQHCVQVMACAAAGKPVFCEKPLALRRLGAQRMFAACRRAGVPLCVGHNRRFWPSMRAVRQIVAAGELGTILHIEGHNSNQNSQAVLSGWRLSPKESPAGGLTGAGLHVLDAFISIVGPARSVYAQLCSHKPSPPPLDTVSVMLTFANGVSGTLATIRATPVYWRVHVFGTDGSAEVLDETTLLLRKSGARPERREYQPIDALQAELDAFADALDLQRPYPVTEAEVLATLAAFEAAIRSVKEGRAVACDEK
ncbi:MAG: Gfo/Idh/MocA family oxidoreductase [Hyphomonadaceae bacterium]|nr:Gfo/Idh/MocA family oxidoreductase [Hyphomonadaceae bacterium]